MNLEIVLRGFLSRVAYLIFLDAFIVSRLTTNSGAGAARFLAVVALAIPALFAGRFLLGVTPAVRQRLVAITVRDPRIAPAFACLAAAVGLIVASAAGPDGIRAGLAGGAAGLSLLSRIALWVQVDKHSRAARNLKPRPTLSTATLWLIAAAFGASTLMLAYGTATAHIAGITGAAVTLVAAAACAAIVACILRRRRTRTEPLDGSMESGGRRGRP